nr:hypothetical protein [Propionicimonas sp.]
MPLVVEELLVEAQMLHRNGAPPGEVDAALTLAKSLLAGEAYLEDQPLLFEQA